MTAAVPGRPGAIQAARVKAEPVLPAGADVGEGPVWDDRTGTLSWVDIHAGTLHVLDPRTGADRVRDTGAHLGAAVPRRQGGWIIARREGFALLDALDGPLQWIARPLADDPAVRLNDGGCDPAGRFWAGSMSYDGTPGLGRLWCIGADGTVVERLTGVGLSNGIAWTDDGRTCYYVDTSTRRVDVFDADPRDGTLGRRRTFVEVPAEQGWPDGITLDADGALWVALFGGARVHRYTPEGRLDMVVELPVSNVTSCTFGGADLDELYITTARFGLDEAGLAGEPLAGAVFVARPGCTGLPARRFAG